MEVRQGLETKTNKKRNNIKSNCDAHDVDLLTRALYIHIYIYTYMLVHILLKTTETAHLSCQTEWRMRNYKKEVTSTAF